MPIQQLVTPDNFMSITYLNSSKIWHPIFFVKGHGKVIERHSFRFLSFCYRFALCRVSKDGLIKALDKQNTDFCLNEMIYKKGVSFCSIFFSFSYQQKYDHLLSQIYIYGEQLKELGKPP